MSFTRLGPGRLLQTNCRKDHHTIRNARIQPISSADIQAQVAPSLGTSVCSRTCDGMGAISNNMLSSLVLIRCSMITAQRYIHDILQPHALPLMQQLPGAIFQQDNARPCMTKVSQYCLRTLTTIPGTA
ncbi:transposable element Tcb1 transposase [Trichonephila clavipes]|uniref:Transposable element Tcb1 transposase n=1 Tax=Trichonephila clavipes TaxID=2585209 RepID=A0A8X6RKK8_TRICX|nr:transposable element Tcb1 transposase [Trichonephila clavipes]